MKISELPKVNPDLCSGCGVCVNICPADAIIMENGIARIIEEKCSGCYACQNVCQMGAIS